MQAIAMKTLTVAFLLRPPRSHHIPSTSTQILHTDRRKQTRLQMHPK